MELDDQITVRVPRGLTERAESLADERDESKSETFRTALRRGLSALDEDDVAVADA